MTDSTLKGTFACPICGQDTPHHHTQEEIEAVQPTVAGVIADCRYNLKLLRMEDCTDATQNVVASIYERIIDRLERVRGVAQPVAATAREPVAWQFRQRSAVGKGPQSSLSWCDWCCIEREDYDRYVRQPNKLVQVRPLYADDAQQAPNRMDKGRAFYLAMYEKDGAIWAANDHKGLWCDMAEDYERRLSKGGED